MKKNSKKETKEPIIVEIPKFGRLKLNYFTDGLTFAIFNTRQALIEDARNWVFTRELLVKSKKAEKLETTRINAIVKNGIMSIFDEPKRLMNRATRLFLFRLLRITDDFYSSGAADAEFERQKVHARTTADGQDAKKLKTLYYIDAVNSRLESIETRDLKFHARGGVTRKDERDFDPLSSSKLASDLFGSLSAAQAFFEKHLTYRIELIKDNIKEREKELELTTQKLENLKQETAVYLKPSSDKKPEKFGNIRI